MYCFLFLMVNIWNLNYFLQHLVKTYGDYFLKAIQKLSQGLNLPLDGVASLQTDMVRKVDPQTSEPRKLSSVNLEARKMWHEDGLSIQQIAVCHISY